MPRSERDREGLRSIISLSTYRVSPGRVGFGQVISAPAPTMPPEIGRPLSTNKRMVIAAVCHPLATSSPKKCAHRGLGTKMERLWVELPGKRHNLIFVDPMRLRAEALPDVHVVQEISILSARLTGIGHDC